MKFIAIISCFVLTISLNQILCELIFEDDFNELDLRKWAVLNRKGDCTGFPLVDSNCNTDNEVNLRTISGMLAITAKHQRYFYSHITMATILSKKKFPFIETNKTSIFKLRASLPIIRGLIPRVMLFSDRRNFITIVNFNETIWYGLDEISDKVKKSYNGTDFREFNEYEMRIEQGENGTNSFKWFLNGKEVFQKQNPKNHHDFFQGNSNSKGLFFLVITLNVDYKIMYLDQFIKDESCHTFLIDYIKVYQLSNIENNTDEMVEQDNSNEICDRIYSLENKTKIKFTPANFSKSLFSEEFDKNNLDANKWNIEVFNENYTQICYQNERKSTMKNCEKHQVYEIISGYLRIYTTIEKSTWNFISTKYFKRARFEIRVKLPKSSKCQDIFILNFSIKPHISCKRNGSEIDIAYFNTKVDMKLDYVSYRIWNLIHSVGDTHSTLIDTPIDVRDETLNSREYQVYGIEWNDLYIQWFLNDRVVYQANDEFDSLGNMFRLLDERPCLPLDFPFKLLISFRSFAKNITQSRDCYIEIDYVKVFGSEYLDDQVKFKLNDQAKSTDNTILVYSLISGLIMLTVIMVVTMVIMMRRQSIIVERTKDDQDGNSEYYDDIELENEIESTHNYESVFDNDIEVQNNEQNMSVRDYLQIHS